MRSVFYRLLRMVITCMAVALLGGCGWHHSRKPKSYDRAVSDDNRDPTYHADFERADVETRDAR